MLYIFFSFSTTRQRMSLGVFASDDHRIPF